MTILVDTSAFLAVLNADDQNHRVARATWEKLISQDAVLICTNYVLVETFALIQKRLGMEAVRIFQEDVVSFVQIEWLDAASHSRSVAALLTANRRQLSLVDCASFDTMRQLGIISAFAFDPHFTEQGFTCIP
jgi:predicted nucleic acid-binding protein